MKTRSLITALFVFAGAATVPAFAQGPNAPSAPRNVIQAAAVSLDAATAETLLWMREEEKLARDVYINLYDKWKKPVFKRISRSEQRHFDAVGAKIELYRLSDPAQPELGRFSDPELQSMYDELMASGRSSYVQALTVGATIEDMDIRDLQAAIEATDIAALKTTYQNLLEGSKNHLRAFVELLQDLGVGYEPKAIDPVLFDAIVGG